MILLIHYNKGQGYYTMLIRKYQVSDKENLRKICIATAPTQKNHKRREILTLLYNDYYTEQEKENCFVVADDDNNAIGYIICSADFKKYKKIFRKIYLPKIRRISFFQYLIKLLSLYTMESAVARKYPAHLHIDLLKSARSMGFGTKLLDTLLTHLRKIGVKGINLGVNPANSKAIKFYFKNGFSEYINFPFVKIMVNDLQK